MRLVVDSNVVFTIIIAGNKSKAFRIIKDYNLTLYFPEDGLLEFKKHKDKLKKYSKEFELKSFLAFSLIHVIPSEIYEDKIPEAYNIAKQFDEKDSPFIALALKLNIPIWTNDKKLIEYGLKTNKYLALDSESLDDLLKGTGIDEIKQKLEKKYLQA
ncbi:PIN domain-containing protein [Archaeoglobus sp.]